MSYFIGVMRLALKFGRNALTAVASGPASDGLLLETGDFCLMETGDYLLLE